MHSRRSILILSLSLSLSLSLLFLAVAARGEVEITLKNAFIAKFKERATINAKFTFDKAHAHPNPAKKDGDLHAAGRAPEIVLATVAEIMNAKDEVAGVGAIHDVEGTNATRAVIGAWRLWAEHGGGQPHVQGRALQKFDSTNPDHVFQIHPLTKIGDIDMRDSIHPIEGFTYKNAEDAFTLRERALQNHAGRHDDQADDEHGGLQLRRVHHGGAPGSGRAAEWEEGLRLGCWISTATC